MNTNDTCPSCGRHGRKAEHEPKSWAPRGSYSELRFCRCGCKGRTSDRYAKVWKCGYIEFAAFMPGHEA